MAKIIHKLRLFSTLEKNVFTLSTISLGLFGYSTTAGKDWPQARIACKIGAVIVLIIAIMQLIITNMLLKKNKEQELFNHMTKASKVYVVILGMLGSIFIYNIIKDEIL